MGTVLQGSDRWVDSYVEIPNLKFEGVNQGPQAAARFALEGKIFFSRVRYAVIRPCGPKAGANLLDSCKPALAISKAGDMLHFAWSPARTGISSPAIRSPTEAGPPSPIRPRSSISRTSSGCTRSAAPRSGSIGW